MATFNLKKKKQTPKPKETALHRLRSLLGDHIRPSDLDGCSEEEIAALVMRVQPKATKVALHGTADNWFDAPANPYQTSPLVNYQGGEFGGRWRNNMPGSGDQHINDDADKVKNLRGNGLDQATLKDKIVNDTVVPSSGSYMVYIPIHDGRNPEEIAALLGENAKFDGHKVYIIIEDFDSARAAQGMVPGAILEKRSK